MCGIVCVFNCDEGNISELRSQVLKQSGKIRHRGPDWSGIYVGNNVLMAHERLAVVDPQIRCSTTILSEQKTNSRRKRGNL